MTTTSDTMDVLYGIVSKSKSCIGELTTDITSLESIIDEKRHLITYNQERIGGAERMMSDLEDVPMSYDRFRNEIAFHQRYK